MGEVLLNSAFTLSDSTSFEVAIEPRMEHKAEVEEEAQALHLLSPAISDISEGSVATVVNSPSPRHFHQGFGCESSSDHATQDKDASTVHLLIDNATTGPETPHVDLKDRSLHYVSAPPKHGTDGHTWPLDASKQPHVYFNAVAPGGIEKVRGKGLKVSEDMIQKSRKDFFSIIILLISLYSLAMSGLWLGIALRRPHWGHRISSHGIVKPNDASLVSTLLAKSIEVSFGATFVAFLGQELSHRAFFDPSRGISIAEMSMRAWVVQPGTMIAHWNRLRCGVSSSLGLATFFVAWFAMLYTSASDALGKISHRIPYACPRASRCPVLYVLRIG